MCQDCIIGNRRALPCSSVASPLCFIFLLDLGTNQHFDANVVIYYHI